MSKHREYPTVIVGGGQQFELGEDVGDMGLDGLSRHRQSIADGLIRSTFGIYRQGGQLTWWDVGRGSSALVVTLHDERLSRVIVEVDDPGVMRELVQAAADAALPTEPPVG